LDSLGQEGIFVLNLSSGEINLQLKHMKISRGIQYMLLTSLDLSYNSIGEEDKSSLRAWAKKKFIKLDL